MVALASLLHTVCGNSTLFQPISEGRTKFMRLMTYWFGKLNSKLRASQCAYFTTRIHLLGKFILLTNPPESAVDRQEDAGVDWRFCPHTLASLSLVCGHRMTTMPVDPRHTHSEQEQHPPLRRLCRRESWLRCPRKRRLRDVFLSWFPNTHSVSVSFRKVLSFPLDPGSSTVPCCLLSYGQPCGPKQATWEASAGVWASGQQSPGRRRLLPGPSGWPGSTLPGCPCGDTKSGQSALHFGQG